MNNEKEKKLKLVITRQSQNMAIFPNMDELPEFGTNQYPVSNVVVKSDKYVRNDPIETGVVFNAEDGTELFNGVAEVAIRAKCPHDPPCISCQNPIFQVIPITMNYRVKKTPKRMKPTLTLEEIEKNKKPKIVSSLFLLKQKQNIVDRVIKVVENKDNKQPESNLFSVLPGGTKKGNNDSTTGDDILYDDDDDTREARDFACADVDYDDTENLSDDENVTVEENANTNTNEAEEELDNLLNPSESEEEEESEKEEENTANIDDMKLSFKDLMSKSLNEVNERFIYEIIDKEGGKMTLEIFSKRLMDKIKKVLKIDAKTYIERNSEHIKSLIEKISDKNAMKENKKVIILKKYK